jgi:hypothetical protein
MSVVRWPFSASHCTRLVLVRSLPSLPSSSIIVNMLLPSTRPRRRGPYLRDPRPEMGLPNHHAALHPLHHGCGPRPQHWHPPRLPLLLLSPRCPRRRRRRRLSRRPLGPVVRRRHSRNVLHSDALPWLLLGSPRWRLPRPGKARLHLDDVDAHHGRRSCLDRELLTP